MLKHTMLDQYLSCRQTDRHERTINLCLSTEMTKKKSSQNGKLIMFNKEMTEQFFYLFCI